MANVDALLSVEQYRAARSHIFPTATSLDWHLRTHKREWIKAGALLVLAGRRMVNPAIADELVLKAGQAAAEATA